MFCLSCPLVVSTGEDGAGDVGGGAIRAAGPGRDEVGDNSSAAHFLANHVLLLLRVFGIGSYLGTEELSR